jgi:hypothetical protein
VDLNFRSLQGLDSGLPMLQLGATMYRGAYETILGTELLLSDAHAG